MLDLRTLRICTASPVEARRRRRGRMDALPLPFGPPTLVVGVSL